ncbi:hypothetical protein I549_0231 [Mycobacterium avium subsp. avium 2285 (R)]|nr:hypothetical protein I549_0231 [Mycobacterium avium subsp. avium 2285 (R)]
MGGKFPPVWNRTSNPAEWSPARRDLSDTERRVGCRTHRLP